MKKIKLKIVLSLVVAILVHFFIISCVIVLREAIPLIILLAIAIFYWAHKIKRKLKKEYISLWWKLITILTLIICYINATLLTLFVASLLFMQPIRRPSQKMKSKDNLKQIYQLLMIYNMDYNSLPKITSEGGNGVRDFYPLYESGIMKRDQLALFHPPNVKLQPFSENPTIDEFDKDHIGYAYNSTAEMDSDSPLLSEQGVSDGILNKKEKEKGLKPVFENVAHVLFANAKIEKIPADKKGNLSTNLISKEEWKVLKD